MSQENVEVVRRWFTAFNHRDMDALIKLTDPDVEFRSSRAEWRGRGSGAEGSRPLTVATWLRAGKVFRLETFTDRESALEAVGLSEQDAHGDS